MASDLSSSRLCTESDLKRLRWVIGWQSPGFNGKMWCCVASLTGVQPSEFIYFPLYALSGHILQFSSFFLTLMEYHNLQPQHVSLHSIMLVAIFMHLYEMYLCV
jgi:hypothetical protein